MAAKITFPIAKRYDTKFLATGEVQVKGFDLDYIDTGSLPAPLFWDMAVKISYDIGEQAFSHYLIAKDQGKPLTAIPVFPSRFFPHVGITVTKQSSIRSPRDLVGKRVGVPGFGYNPAAWMRGILAHQYDVPVEKIIWVEDAKDPFFAGLDYPRSGRFTVEKADNILQLAATTMTSEALETGRIDALIAPAWGPELTDKTRRLFEDPYAEIRAYLRTGGVYPINTVILLKQEVVKAHPQLPGGLMVACMEARRRYQDGVLAGKEADHMGLQIDALREMGLFPDRYGVDANRTAIRMMITYCYEQGLIRTLFEPEELFVS
jgi:4,5-dihydroxyphthalate decarboxylase